MPKRTPLVERFWAKVDKDGPLPAHRPDLGPCWLWIATKNQGGYGRIRADRNGQLLSAHRVAYELLVGSIPDGLDLDHLCRVRHCVNSAHLEPVTRKVNMERGTRAQASHCKHGHEYTPANTNWTPRGRECRDCRRMYAARKKARQHRNL